jgi:hypothetical protein
VDEVIRTFVKYSKDGITRISAVVTFTNDQPLCSVEYRCGDEFVARAIVHKQYALTSLINSGFTEVWDVA